MKIIIPLSFCFCSFFSFSQEKGVSIMELANKKDSEAVNMVIYYLTSDFKKLAQLFPGYKKYTETLKIIKAFSKCPAFEMNPNFLISRQGSKTDIILAMSNQKHEVIAFSVVFNSNKLSSKIESIKREKKFDRKPEETIEIIEDQ